MRSMANLTASLHPKYSEARVVADFPLYIISSGGYFSLIVKYSLGGKKKSTIGKKGYSDLRLNILRQKQK
jgi:hypothetical protein